MVIIKVSDVGNFGGLFYGYIDGKDITIDRNITHEGIEQVNQIIRYEHERRDMLVDKQEKYLCAAGSVR